MNNQIDCKTCGKLPTVSALAIIALVTSLLASPCIDAVIATKVAWLGRHFQGLGTTSGIIAFTLLSLISLSLGITAFVRIKTSKGKLCGIDMAISAIVMSILWLTLIAISPFLVPYLVPHPD